jgi:hypothetical protein
MITPTCVTNTRMLVGPALRAGREQTRVLTARSEVGSDPAGRQRRERGTTNENDGRGAT